MPIRTRPARITTAVRPARSRRWLTSGALIALTTGLGLLAPQGAVALAQSPRPATIGAGNAHSCTIESGKAYCWGENDYGQLGNGSTTDSSVPVPVDTRGVLAGKTLTQISAGGGGGVDTCALDRAGAAFCWGSNSDGALGDGKTAASFSSVPVAVDTRGVLAGKTLTQISAGSDGGCVLDRQGAAYCWGDNDYGELGNGRAVSSSVPVTVNTRGVLADKTLTQISAGYEDTCGLDSRGAAYCWGDNYYLELGDGSSRAYSSVPVAVSASGALAGRRLTQLSACFWYECAVDTAGAAFCWGTGALGSATASSSGVPVAVDTSGVLAGRRSRRSRPASARHAPWPAGAPPSAGVTTPTASLATGARSAPMSRSPWTPPARWPARRWPRSPAAPSTPARRTLPAPTTAGATTPLAISATTAPPRATCRCWPGRRRPPTSRPFR